MSKVSATRVSSTRISPDQRTVLKNLGLLQDLAGIWEGTGFNLIARPDFHDRTDVYLQLNQTRETLKFELIGSAIPNRGFGQDDIELFGLTYLQQIADAALDGALHIETGIWITQPATTFPPDSVAAPRQLVARMGTVPHGSALLAEGFAEPFTGSPVLTTPGAQYSFSLFPSFNSTPLCVPPTVSDPPGTAFYAAGTSEAVSAPLIPAPAFPQYDMSVPIGPIPLGPLNPPFTLNTRTPFDTTPPEPELPPDIDGVPMQDVINDPILLLQKDVERHLANSYTFEGVALNIATTTPLKFFQDKNSPPTGAAVQVAVPQFGGGIANIKFLGGESPLVGGQTRLLENAETAIVYATFWLEKLTNHRNGDSFMQLQYAQMVLLNFPVFGLLYQTTPPTYMNVGWPHVTVATLRRTFG
jgi:hypothetical protein